MSNPAKQKLGCYQKAIKRNRTHGSWKVKQQVDSAWSFYRQEALS
jgi:hypothetical protein